MKIQMEFDITPQELREVFGLPDLQPLHEEVMGRIRDKVVASVDNYDPMQFMSAYSAEGTRGLREMQEAMWRTFTGGGRKDPE